MKILYAIALISFSITLNASNLEVVNLTCEYLIDPIGLEESNPRFAWKIAYESDRNNVSQSAYEIQVSENDFSFNSIVWDSGKIFTDKSNQIRYEGENLKPKTIYFWRVKIWDNSGRESGWSETASLETGIMDPELWKATWISPDLKEIDTIDNPAPFLRKEFQVLKPVKKARLYITSRGLYQGTINGIEITDQLFTPGYTSFNKRLQYQVYNVTDHLKTGQNAAGVMLGDGWYRGRFGFAGNVRNMYGKELALLFQLEIEYEDGEREMIISDSSWRSKTGPIRMSNIYDGEIYDANFELGQWDQPNYDDKSWHGVLEKKFSFENVVPSVGVPVKRIETLPVKAMINTPKGEKVFDFGQNLVGRIKLNLEGKKGDTITIFHAEVLDKEGNFYTANLRSAKQRIQYVFGSDGITNYEPLFTFQGFRYIMIEDFEGELGTENISAIVIHSEMPQTGSFECSNEMVNQLQKNIQWGQKGNFLDVPTDCPQRDERMGWTGDAQAFASTAIFNFNTAAFYTKWMKDVAADQFENGSIPFVVPDVLKSGGSTGWGDVVTILPITMYDKYNDVRILENHYSNMKRWVDFLKNLAGDDHIVNDGFHFGDWLFFIHPTQWNNKPGHTDNDFISTAFFAHSTSNLIRAAEILGYKEDVIYYSKMLEQIKSEFQHEFITSSGRLSPHSQTAYVLALHFGLIPESGVEKAVGYLVENISSRGFHLTTGFLGTPYICHVLTRNGYTDIAYKLLLREEYPSWLYPVTQGATTIWERWDGIKPDGSFQTTQMNSFNHYAYGAVGDWMYSVVSGIKSDPKMPGYKHFIVKPEPGEGLSYAKAIFESNYGQIVSDWRIENGTFYLNVIIPPNTTATVYLPGIDKGEELGSGSYDFQVEFGS